MTNDPPYRQGAFFGRRKGHPLRARQADVFSTLLPRLAIDLAAAALARVDLLYPDPWPKRRHWKRRFVQDRTIAELARIVRPGGEFRFVSDIPDYVAWTLERLLRQPAFAWTAERADDWRRPWDGFVTTRYEAKATQAGRVPGYLIFRRQ